MSKNGLTGKFVADITLQIMSYVAQLERENIHQRQVEGIREAKNRGIRFGRPEIPLPDAFADIYARWINKKISKREAARLLQTNHMTFGRWVKRFEKKTQDFEQKVDVLCQGHLA